jgi:hypothetical protein
MHAVGRVDEAIALARRVDKEIARKECTRLRRSCEKPTLRTSELQRGDRPDNIKGVHGDGYDGITAVMGTIVIQLPR